MAQSFLERMKSWDVPESIDDTNREFKDLPEKTWFLGEVPAAGTGASWGLNEKETRDGESWLELKCCIKPIGAQDSINVKATGPYASLFFRPRISEWDEATKSASPDQPALRLIALANSLFSYMLPKGSKERFNHTLAELSDLSSLANYNEDAWPNDSARFAAMLSLAVGAAPERPRILFTVRQEKQRQYTGPTGETMLTKPRLTLASFEDATEENLLKRKIVLW